MELRKFVGERIKHYRNRNGMNQEQLAEMLGTTKQSVSRYETGERRADQDMLFELSSIFKVGIDEFFPIRDQSDNSPTVYPYHPVSVSAGVPTLIDGVTHTETVTVPDSIMGKWAGQKDIFMMRINGDSMNKIMPSGSLIAVKPIEISSLKNGDIVVFSDGVDYAVKRFERSGDYINFKPESTDDCFKNQIFSAKDNIQIHGRVVLYIAELD